MTTNDEAPQVFYVDPDRMAAAAMLDGDNAPTLTDEQFEALVEEMKQSRLRAEEGLER